MAKRDILKEAIADAKAVKEVAIANAKAALEEAFTPKLKSMLATKIEEMEKEEEKDEEEKTNEMLDTRTNIERHGMEGDTDPEERRTELEIDNMKDREKGYHDFMQRSSRMEEDEDLDEEVDLDEILAELETEITETEITEADESEAERADVDKYEYEEGKEEGEDEDADEAEELDLEDMTDEDLKVFIEDVISDMVGSGELEAGENFEEEDVDVEVEDDVDVDVESEEEVEINEYDREWVEFCKDNPDWHQCESKINKVKTLMNEGKKGNKEEQKRAEGAIRDDRDHIKKLKGDIEDQEKKLAKLKKDAKKELDEAYKAVDTLRSELSEVNLLNAKLLYTNKIFKSKNLTESQKVKVLGAFDNATTVKESKLVFETLSEGLKSKKKPIRESLGRASKSLGTTKSKKPIIEADPMVSRFQKLAGIK